MTLGHSRGRGRRDALRREYARQQRGGRISIGAVRVPSGSQLTLKASPAKATLAGLRTGKAKVTVVQAKKKRR